MTISETIFLKIKQDPQIKTIFLSKKEMLQLIDEGIYSNCKTYNKETTIMMKTPSLLPTIEFFNIDGVSIHCK